MAGVPLGEGLVTRSMELELFASLPVAGQDEFVPVSPSSPPASQVLFLRLAACRALEAAPEDGPAPAYLLAASAGGSAALGWLLPLPQSRLPSHRCRPPPPPPWPPPWLLQVDQFFQSYIEELNSRSKRALDQGVGGGRHK